VEERMIHELASTVVTSHASHRPCFVGEWNASTTASYAELVYREHVSNAAGHSRAEQTALSGRKMV